MPSQSPIKTKKLADLLTDMSDTDVKKGQVISYLVGWSVGKATGEYEDLRKFAERGGYEEFMPRPLTPEKRMKLVCEKLEVERGIISRKLISKDTNWVTYRFTKPKRKKNTKAEDPFSEDEIFQALKGLAINSKTGEIVLEDKKSKLLRELEKKYKVTEGKFNYVILRYFLKKVMSRCFFASPFPSKGGALIVPATENTRDDLLALQEMVESIEGCTFDFEYFCRRTRMAERAAERAILPIWTGMVRELEAFLETSPEKLVHPRGFHGKLLQAELLRRKLAIYHRILGADRLDMERAVSSFSVSLNRICVASDEARALIKPRRQDKPVREQMARTLVEEGVVESKALLERAKTLWPPTSPVYGRNYYC